VVVENFVEVITIFVGVRAVGVIPVVQVAPAPMVVL
jgi:hypothetical protein